MADLQPVIFPPLSATVVTLINESGTIVVAVPETAPIIETPVETIVVIDASTPSAPETIIVELSDVTVVIMAPQAETVVVMESAEIVVVTAMEGPQGPSGPVGDAIMTGVAGQTLAAFRVIRDNDGLYFYADQAVEADAGTIIGVTTASAAISTAATVQIMGELYNPAWAWAIGQPVFVSGLGQPTQTPPTSGAWVLQIGVATHANRLFIRPLTPIYL